MIVPSKFGKIFFVVFAFLHLTFAVCFAAKTPYRTGGFLFSQRDPETGGPQHVGDIGAPDERQHANYVEFLLREKKLPVFNPSPKAPGSYENYQSHQPPLFYALGSVVAAKPDASDGGFGFRLRMLNCLIGALGVVGVFFACLWATKREDVAIVATAFVALIPMNCALSGAISNDPLLIALVTWCFAFCARAMHEEDPKLGSKAMMYAGLFAGLACLTKSSGLIALVGVFATAFTLRKILPLKGLALAGILAILLPLPIWIRNTSLYGDPMVQKAFKSAFGGSAQKSLIISIIEATGAPGSSEVQYWINWVGYWTARSFIGVFGYMDIWINRTGRANVSSDPNLLYKVLIALIVTAKLSFLMYLRNKWKEVPKPIFIGLVFALVTFALFIGFNMTYFQAQARYLYPAIAPTALILAIGWLQLFRSKLVPVLLLVVVAFGGTTLYALTQLGPEFATRQSGTVSPP